MTPLRSMVHLLSFARFGSNFSKKLPGLAAGEGGCGKLVKDRLIAHNISRALQVQRPAIVLQVDEVQPGLISRKP
jgi:hypothetical protein